MNAHRSMHTQVAAYLAVRRQAGFALTSEATQLASFARYADDLHHRGPLTLKLACDWALASEHGRRLTAARRIEVLRGFARYCRQFDAATVIPPLALFGPGHRRLTPHIYTEQEIQALLTAAAQLPPISGLRAVNCTTILGLIAATGLRVSEATGLARADVDLKLHRLHIRHAKFGKARWVPMHPSTTRALQAYALRRDHAKPPLCTDAFFVDDRGRAFQAANVQYAFKQLRQQLGWRARGGHPAPRIHDLRHTFICRRLLRWYQTGRNVNHLILALATYVGHAKVTDTYWYLTATPELMAIAARRFERCSRGVL